MAKKRKVYSIKIIRKLLALKQKQFAKYVGISPVYMSQIESGFRTLTIDTAAKIAKLLSDLTLNKKQENQELNIIQEHDYFKSEEDDFDYTPQAKEIISHHIASFYDNEVQETIIELIGKRDSIDRRLDYIFNTGLDNYNDNIQTLGDEISIFDELESNLNGAVKENLLTLNNEYAKRKKPKPRL